MPESREFGIVPGFIPNFHPLNLRQQQNSPDWGSDVKDLLNKGINKPRKGHDAGDHPPITPMRAATHNELDGDSWKIYDYVVRHFIGTVSYNCKYHSTMVKFEINGEKFSFTGKKLSEPGFTAVMTWQALTDDESVPNLSKNDVLEVSDVKLAVSFNEIFKGELF